MASETSAIALRAEEIRKEMPIATASVGGVANLSHDLFFILLCNITIFFVCSEIGFIMGLSRKLNYLIFLQCCNRNGKSSQEIKKFKKNHMQINFQMFISTMSIGNNLDCSIFNYIICLFARWK